MIPAVVLGVASSPAFPASAGFTLEGDFRQGGMIRGRVSPAGLAVTMDGNPVATRADGRFVIGFGRDHPASCVLRAEGAQVRIDRTLEIAARTYETQHIRGLPERMVTPAAADLERIRDDQARVRAARGHRSLLEGFWEEFRWPVLGIVTGVYGSARVLNGVPRSPHYGIDIAAPRGTPVVAPAAGRVVLAHPDMYYTGATVVLDHGHGVSSTFLHLEKINVPEGRELEAGEPFATVGSSGRSTGPHLDWRVNWGDVRLDPALLVDPMPGPEAP